MTSKRAILIAGPTASGKSSIALSVAKALDGVIINADSMQVYKGLKIITARPGADEMDAIPHALYGVRDPGESYSVADWMAAAKLAAEAAWADGKIPIFTGGTGLYFKALVDGIVDIPEVPEHIRLRLARRVEKEGLLPLFMELGNVDPEIVKTLKPKDKQRILRALEVHQATGKPLSYWQAQNQKPVLPGTDFLKIVIQSPPEELNEKILARLKKMLDHGVVIEVGNFRAKSLSPNLPAAKALGLRPMLRYISHEVNLNEALDLATIETRQYAKRQRTWFRNQCQDWHTVKAGPKAAEEILSLARTTFKD